MALNKIISEGIKDGEVKNADIAADAVDIADLSASGTASSSTFLRGDNAWATPTDTTTPADGTVTEAKLNANAPTNDHVLTADSSAAGGFKWAAAAAGGATINNATENEIVTVASTTTQLDAEANLTFDGNNLKVGAGAATHADADDLVISKDAAISGISIQNADDGYGCLNFGDASDNDIGRIAYNHNGNHMTFAANAATRMEIEDTGDVKINDGNLIIGTSGHGIDFTANTDDETGAGSVSAELLNDYERGTWTPAIVEQGGASYTYGTQDGWYIKIGDLVYVGAYIKITASSGTTSANSHISGFPFSTPDAYNCFSGAYHYSVSEAGGTPKVMRLNGSQLEIFKQHAYSHAADNEIWENGNERFGFGGVYHTS